MHNTAALLFELERYAEAEKLYQHCYDTRKRLFGEEDSRTLNSMVSLAAVYQKTDKRTQAGTYIHFICNFKVSYFNLFIYVISLYIVRMVTEIMLRHKMQGVRREPRRHVISETAVGKR